MSGSGAGWTSPGQNDLKRAGIGFLSRKIAHRINHISPHKYVAKLGNHVIMKASMATTPIRKTRFSRRVPDHVTDELVNVLSSGETLEFNQLFKMVYDNLKLKNAVSGGEEMLRLRSYEKLQGLVSRGLCAKVAKTYRGLEGLRAAHQATIAARNSAVAAR